MVVLKSSRELELMKEACKISAEALMVAGEAVKPGVSTWEIDKVAYDFIRSTAQSRTSSVYTIFLLPHVIC
jgi:methionyl aminopeptidase